MSAWVSESKTKQCKLSLEAMFFNYPPRNVYLKNQGFLYGFYILTLVSISEKKKKSIVCAEKYSPFLHHYLWPFLPLNLSLYLYHNNILTEHVLFFFKAQPGYYLVTMNAPMPESRYCLKVGEVSCVLLNQPETIS